MTWCLVSGTLTRSKTSARASTERLPLPWLSTSTIAARSESPPSASSMASWSTAHIKSLRGIATDTLMDVLAVGVNVVCVSAAEWAKV